MKHYIVSKGEALKITLGRDHLLFKEHRQGPETSLNSQGNQSCQSHLLLSRLHRNIAKPAPYRSVDNNTRVGPN